MVVESSTTSNGPSEELAAKAAAAAAAETRNPISSSTPTPRASNVGQVLEEEEIIFCTNTTGRAGQASGATPHPSMFGALLEEETYLRRQNRRSSLFVCSSNGNNSRAAETQSPFRVVFHCFHVIGTSAMNLSSAILIFIFYLISIESLISIAFSVGLTVYAYNIAKDGDPSTSFDGSAMDWVLLSFAVVTPISASIGMAFTRRERALREIAEFKATTKNLYMAHASWDWCKAGPKAATTGRAASTDVDWLQHNDRVMAVIFRICSDLTRLLTLPTSNRGRHRVSLCGQQQRLQIEQLSRKLQRNIHYDICILSSECEILKREGLPPNEATRVRQWERFISERIEALLMIKRYRTPQALRSFARCFTIFLPPFYAPFYATMAVDLNSLGMAVAFSILTSLALTSLFEAVAQLEDPFVGLRLDGINVERDLRDELLVELIDSRAYYFPNASKFELDIKIPDINHGPAIRLFQAT